MQDSFKMIIKNICDKNDIEYKFLSKDWIMTLSQNGIIKNIVGMTLPINNQSCALILNDKYATYSILKENNIPTIEYNMIFNPKTRSEFNSDLNVKEDLRKYFDEQINNSLVLKINDGFGGKNIYKCQTYDELIEKLNILFETKNSVSVCPFYDIDVEYRLIYLNGEIKLIFGKVAAPGCWKHNLCEGASIIKDIDEGLKIRLKKIAYEAARVTDSNFVSIDIAHTKNDELLVMEINASVCLMKFAAMQSENMAITESIYEEAIKFIMKIDC